jgi:hypothetical protein
VFFAWYAATVDVSPRRGAIVERLAGLVWSQRLTDRDVGGERRASP